MPTSSTTYDYLLPNNFTSHALRRMNLRKSMQKLSFEVPMVKAQLQEPFSNNQEVLTQFESAKSQTQRLLGHKDSEISRLLSDVSSLNSGKAWLDERLAALSASQVAEQVPTQAQRNSGNVESQSLSLHDVQAAVSSQLAPF